MSEEKRFRVTLTMKAEDLMATPEDDAGSEAVIINNTVSGLTRHLMEKSLMQLMAVWGAVYQEQKAPKSGRPG